MSRVGRPAGVLGRGVGAHLPNTGLPCQAVTLHSTQHLAQSPCSLEVKLGRALHGERMRKEGGLCQPQLHLQVLPSWLQELCSDLSALSPSL